MREIKIGQRVMYRYLNKGKSLFGVVVSNSCGYIGVRMTDGTALVRKPESWEIL